MDMRALKVGQKVTLSAALPGAGAEGIVAAVTKWNISVQVPAQIVDGGHWIIFDHNNDIFIFYGWADKKQWDSTGWDISWAIPCPIPGLKIVNSCD
jgi:hypothetical protein